ncbi:MAG: fibronectin type III domain-containing protein, partial [Acidimicrobiales bacterium]
MVTNGKPGWSVQLPGQYLFSSAPTALNGVVYIGGAGSGGTVYAVSENNGAVLWTDSVMNGDNSSPAVSSDGVYVSYACDQTYKFALGGALDWHYATGCEGGGGQTPVLADGYVFLRDIVISASTGVLARSLSSAAIPAVDTTNVYTLNRGTLEAQPVAGGSALWSFAGDGTLVGSPIEVGGFVYVASSSGHLYAVSASTGQQAWSTTLPAAPDTGSNFLASGLAEGDGLLAVPNGGNITVYSPATRPDAPAAPSCSAGNTTATIRWTVPADSGDPITAFTITPYLGSAAQTPISVPAGSVGSSTDSTPGAADSYAVSGLTNGEPYTFTVAATNDGGSGPPSPTCSAVTPSTVPSEVSAPTAGAGQRAAQISWVVPGNGGSPITEFVVTPLVGATSQPATYEKVGGAGLSSTPGAADSVEIPGLTAGESYTFTVAAVNSDGAGKASVGSNVVTPSSGPTAPFAPIGVAAVAGDASAMVSWTVSGNNGDPITGFTVTPFVGLAAQTPVVVNAGSPGSPLDPSLGAGDHLLVPGLGNGTAYSFTVVATNSIGDGPPSTASAVVTPSTVPVAPSNVSATPGNALAVVTWSAPGSTGGLPVTSYILTSSTGQQTIVAGVVTVATVQGLTNGKPVTFTVVAANSDGDSPPSAPSTAVTPSTVPAPPSDVVVTASGPGPFDTAQAELQWTVPTDGGKPISSFTIDVAMNGIRQTPVVVAVGSQGISGTPGVRDILGALVEVYGNTYTYRVTATNADGSGAASGWSNTIAQSSVPEAPPAPSAQAGNSQVLLNWVVPGNNGDPITSFTLSAFVGGTLRSSVVLDVATPDASLSGEPGAHDSAVFAGLVNGTSYTFSIVANNGNGPGDPSAQSAAVTPAANPPPGATEGAPGYWEVAADGGLFAFGDAKFYGSMGGKPLNAPIVGFAATPDGKGYWEVAADGGLFAFGDAKFYGSMGGKPLNAPIVGFAATPDGKGYWEVAADGGLFAFGDAKFYGSMGGKPLNAPIVGFAATPDGKGYWEVAADGGLFAFGDAKFYGSMGGKPLNAPIVGFAATPDGKGYWEVAA